MSWHGADGLSLTSRIFLAADSASKMLRTTLCARRTAQSAEHTTSWACSVQTRSVSSCSLAFKKSKLVIFCITLYWCLSKSMSCFVGPPKPKPKAMKSLNIGQALVSERRKLWQMDGSVSPSSVDSANMNEQERLADFDSAEELDDTHSASARKVCTRLMYQQQQHYILIGRLSSA